MSIPGIDHAISKEVIQSLGNLQFDLEEWDKNPRIGGLLSRTVLSGGKRLRPLLTLLVGDLFGASYESIKPLARVVEMIHAATLAHDDVVDGAQLRRGAPSINSMSSNKKAVLAGDYLLAHSLEEVANLGRSDLVKCLSEIISDLAEGEWIQIENSEKTHLVRPDVDLVALKKTGSVLRWCTKAVPMLLELDEQTLDKAREFGESLGVAFQMTDDILDFKRRDGAEFADIKNKVFNSVIFEVFALSRDSRTINAASIDKIELNEKHLTIALELVGQEVKVKLDRCRELLTDFLKLPVESSKQQARQQAYFSITCIIEYLANRI